MPKVSTRSSTGIAAGNADASRVGDVKRLPYRSSLKLKDIEAAVKAAREQRHANESPRKRS